MATELSYGSPYANRDDNDDLDSLFGDSDTDVTSLFMELTAVAPSPESDCERTPDWTQAKPPSAANPAAQLSFPDIPVQAQRAQMLHLPAVPDPPAAPLSQQAGHTSGDDVVSSQNIALGIPGSDSAAAPSFSDDAALDAELEGLWDSIIGEDQPVNAQTGSQGSDPVQDEIWIPVTQIPGYRYANSKSNSWIRLPRRVDLDPSRARDLLYYLTLNRQTKAEDLYKHLELDIGEGKRLSAEMRKLLKQPQLSQLVRQPNNGVSETKRTLVNISLYMLNSKGWGAAWFGDGCRTAKTRTLFWPVDSSVLLTGFVMLLYRLFYNQRQMHHTLLRTQARLERSIAGSTVSPSPSRSPSEQPADTGASLAPSPDGQAFFMALATDAAASKQRKRDESLILEISSRTPLEVEVPANARLKYHLYVKDKTDGSDLGPPTTFRHTDWGIARGAFACLQSSFKALGHDPIVEIQTPFGRKSIASEGEWEQAVLTIYNVRRSGGVVEVDVFI